MTARLSVGATLLGVALAAWIVTVARMRGMDMGPGTDLGGFGWYIGVWVTMMAAMMLPSALPMVGFVRRIGSAATTWVFIAGYLAAWTAYGIIAYAVARLVRSAGLGFLAWDADGPLIVGIVVVAAGAYQLTPLKRTCLRHCRSPLAIVMHRWRAGRLGALEMGAEHGAYCVGCCAGLMLILFALGVMSLLWMALVAAAIFAEKVLPGGERLSPLLAAAFVVTGVWLAVSPGTFPGLVQP